MALMWYVFFLIHLSMFGVDLEFANCASRKITFDNSMRQTNIENQELFKSIYDTNNLSHIRPRTKTKIPKITHMIWFGNEFPARFHFERQLLIQGHPQWMHVLWVDNPKNYIFGTVLEDPNEINALANLEEYQGKSFIADIKDFKLYNQKYFDKVTKPIEKSDIARYELVYTFGGVYVEADYRLLKPLDILNHSYDFYAGAMQIENALIASNAIFGATPKHLVLKEAIRTIKDDYKYSSSELKTGSLHFTKAFVMQYDNCPGTNIIFPSSFFFPVSHYEHFLEPAQIAQLIKPESFGFSFWMSQWYDAAISNNRHIIGSDPTAGLFSAFLNVISNIAYAEKYQKVPIVYWDEKTLYYEPSGYNGQTNVWEYYFEPVSCGQYNPTDVDYMWRMWGSPILQIWADKSTDPSFIKNLKKTVIDRYIKIKPHILAKVQEFYDKHFAGKKTIGIHLRGTDKHIEQPLVSVQKIIAIANKYADKHTQFFIASDEQKLLDQARKLLEGKVIFYNSYRSKNDQPIHKRASGYNKGKLGEEALIEVLLLAQCNLFIHTISNFSYAVLLFNPDIPHIRIKNEAKS